jgi:ABC-type dipeptide/oligopeptide/nickel transport system permease component
VPFLVATFIVLLLILGLLIFIIAKLIRLPITPNTGPVNNPDTVACSKDEVLQVWLMDYPNSTQYLSWTNNYVIRIDYKM